MSNLEHRQRAICDRYAAAFTPPDVGLRVGISLTSMNKLPLNGLRHPPENGTCGWYLWAGQDWPPDSEWQALCVEHVRDYCPQAEEFLALPPGWRFLTDVNGYVDVWFDEGLLDV